MTTSTRTAALRGSAKSAFTAKRQAGTTLVEILVVIVIFLIGILAVIQIFPGGFRLLLVSRNNSAATALGRDEIERLKDSPELLPDEILAVRYKDSDRIVDSTISPVSLSPVGSNPQIDVNGNMTDDASAVTRDWALASGPNVARRIVGEGHRVPAPRQVGNVYGGLMMVEHGPIDPGADITKPNVAAYANDLTRNAGTPLGWAVSGTMSVSTLTETNSATTVLAVDTISTPSALTPFEYFVADAGTPNASLFIPTSRYNRTYRLRFSALVSNGTSYERADFRGIPLTVPANPNASQPMARVYLNALIAAYRGVAGPLGSVEIDTIRLAPQYVKPPSVGWSGDPFEALLVDPNLGVLVFTPFAREATVTRPGGVEEPLIAKVDYDVLDWRVLREEFRVVNGNASFRLALQSLKVGTQIGPDGRNNGPLPGLESVTDSTDNVVVIDTTTGYRVDESNGFVSVDKSRGLVVLNDADLSTSGLQVNLVPPAGASVLVNAENRTFRILYRARQEWAVQLVKSASQYSVLQPSGAAFAPTPTQGQCAFGISGGSPTRLYFPRSDAGHKVTIDTLTYTRSDNTVYTVEGQDFVVKYRPSGPNLPCIDINLDLDSNAAGFNSTRGEPVRGVKGASVAVRVLWNPDQFRLTSDAGNNLSLIDSWMRGWRKSTTETYLRAEETR